MKKFKKIAALVLAAVMLLSLSACGTIDMKLASAVVKTAKLSGSHLDLNALLDLNIDSEAMNMSMGIQATATGTVDYIEDPLHVSLNLTADAMGESVTVLADVEEVDGEAVARYSTDGGLTWETETLGDAADFRDSIRELDLAELLDALNELGDVVSDFTQDGTVTINGSEADYYEATISGAALGELMKDSGADDMLADELGVDVTLDFSNVEDIVLALCVDQQTGLLSAAGIDMGAMMQSFMDSYLNQVLEASGLADEDTDFTVTINDMGVEVYLSALGTEAPLTVPGAVATGSALTVPSTWYGTLEVKGHSGRGDLEDGLYEVWGLLDTNADGDLFFELYDTEDIDNADWTVLSFWATVDGNRIVPEIGYEDAWLLDIYLIEADTEELTFVLEDGVLTADYFYYNSEGPEACDIAIVLNPMD